MPSSQHIPVDPLAALPPGVTVFPEKVKVSNDQQLVQSQLKSYPKIHMSQIVGIDTKITHCSYFSIGGRSFA